MKELDFVKLTLWLSALLAVAFFGGWIYKGSQISKCETDIKAVERACKEIGKIAKDINVLEEEKRNDKAPQDSADRAGILTYFSEQAKRVHFNPGQDYVFKPRDPETNKGGWVDTAYVVDFKKDKPKFRDNLMKFLWYCETQSRRIKLQKARLSLAEENAVQDFWSADSLTFVQRSPSKKVASN